MGLIEAAKNAVQNVFADTWREFFYCDRMEDDVLMVKGEKKISGKSSNKKGTDNIISNSSIIAVNEGQ
ncbi:MAG: SPFH domain-containing protein, partial [Lachnospiraceae bacterium]|nr:SPFH domain-containing protein [Lachnospiraceae bacterium]